jgi:hypothetical protein
MLPLQGLQNLRQKQISVNKLKWPLLLALLGVTFACGYDGSYRYSCQDPENWGSAECEPPICKVDGACTDTLLGWDPSETTIEQEIPTEETVAP